MLKYKLLCWHYTVLSLAGDRLRQVLGHTRARRPRRKSAYGDEVPVRAPRKLDMVGLQGALGFCLTCKPVWQLALIKRPRPLVRWIGL